MRHISNHPRIEMVRTAELKPNGKNPRTHSDKQIQLIASSITRFGFVIPIIIDDQSRIAAGHAKWEAAKLLDLSEVPTIRVSFLTEADRRAFALAENRLAELGGWDQELLTEELNWLFENDYDIDITGFTLADMDFSIGDGSAGDMREEVELPAIDAHAVSRLGDLWNIGPHRIYCGDSTQATSYEVLLESHRAAMIFSDPPYNVPIAGHVSGSATAREFAMASGEMTPPEFTAFLRSVFRCCVMFSSDGSIHYQCMDFRHMREMLDASEGIYRFKQLVVWDKRSGGMGAFYRAQHELIFVFKSGKAKHINNFGLGQTGRYRTNLWSCAGANAFRKGGARDLADHPTIKPTALVMDAILDCSNRGDIILDPFSGSGTTLIAAHKIGRRGAAIELDPLYVDTAIRRLCDASGLVAMHADGRNFDEVAAARAVEREVSNV
ncbi:MAG: site-specific DNA-methyltransferase [Sphingorhabdus sp.]|uniref:site-specific DNA-methyltransferase n=1 Tax=Sphingorhabdus sp. TaxID=1902408 RepID=UPI0038FD362E